MPGLARFAFAAALLLSAVPAFAQDLWAEAECQKLVRGFQELNQRMLREMRKQQGR